MVVTPSHNPPADGGFKYNPPNGGPADTDVTRVDPEPRQRPARAPASTASAGSRTRGPARPTPPARYDYLDAYVGDLPTVLDLDAVREAGVRIGADPLGGASVGYWGEIGERYGLDLTVVNPLADPTWRFMTLDWDGKIRMDCSSPYAMASLVGPEGAYQIATGNDADADRHGIVTPDAGLMNPNHYLAVAIDYLYRHRSGWPAGAAIGKTLVSSSMIDRVAADLGRHPDRVPVGFKWFVPGPGQWRARVRRRGERRCLVPAPGRSSVDDRQGRHPALPARLGDHGRDREVAERALRRADRTVRRAGLRPGGRAGDPEQKAVLARLSPEQVTATELAGEPITAALTSAPGNGAPIGGLKVTTESGWFAARPSGTEDVYKIYAESFRGADHLAQLQQEATGIVSAALAQ